MNEFLEFNDSSTRGHICKITKPRCNKSDRQKAFLCRCIDDWNNLEEDIVTS